MLLHFYEHVITYLAVIAALAGSNSRQRVVSMTFDHFPVLPHMTQIGTPPVS